MLGLTYSFMVVKHILPHNGFLFESWSDIYDAVNTDINEISMVCYPVTFTSHVNYNYLLLHIECFKIGEVLSKPHILHEHLDVWVGFPIGNRQDTDKYIPQCNCVNNYTAFCGGFKVFS